MAHPHKQKRLDKRARTKRQQRNERRGRTKAFITAKQWADEQERRARNRKAKS